MTAPAPLEFAGIGAVFLMVTSAVPEIEITPAAGAAPLPLQEVLIALIGLVGAIVVAYRVVQRSKDGLAKHALTEVNAAHQQAQTAHQQSIAALQTQLGVVEQRQARSDARYLQVEERWNECEKHRREDHARYDAKLAALRQELLKARET